MFPATTFRRAAVLAAAAAALGSAAELAAQPTTGRQPLSPRDTVRMELAGGHRISIDYGRPYRRGRKIMGELVPFGRVWRTGANAATTLSTDVDLRIGNATVPRGTYTLYTLPTAGQWTLIVNRQTGQWGTQYDASRDLVRIPLQKRALERPVEQFTISLEPAQGGGTLVLTWENTRVSVPFRVVTGGHQHPPQPQRRGP
ncbi:MAG TPA: DUF2911 domain-containing protein [Longimicrobiaceae bacterium]|nr:DUF2911 domain-containing protein [Longimicrobiaceae bacterium]